MSPDPPRGDGPVRYRRRVRKIKLTTTPRELVWRWGRPKGVLGSGERGAQATREPHERARSRVCGAVDCDSAVVSSPSPSNPPFTRSTERDSNDILVRRFMKGDLRFESQANR